MAVGAEFFGAVADDTSALIAEIAAEQVKNLTPTDLGLFLNLFSDAPLNYVVDEALLGGLRRIKQRGLIDILEDRLEMGATVTVRDIAGLTDNGSRAAEGLLTLLPVPDPEILGEDVRILIDLASSTRVKVKKTRRSLRAIENLVRSGHIKTIASSENPLTELNESFNLDDVVELTRLGRRLLRLEKATETTPESVPLVFPVRLHIEHKDGEKNHSAPLHLMPWIFKKDYRLSWDFSSDTIEGLGHSNPFAGRKWTYVIVMYDHESKAEQTLTVNSKLFHKALYKGEASKNTGVTGKALALFLIPLDDRTPYEKLRNGEGTFYEFDDNKRFREVLSKVIEISGSVKSATPLDLKSDIAQALLKEVGLDSTVREPEKIMEELQKLETLLVNGKIPSKLGDGALKVTQGLLAGILGPASVPLGLAVNALKALRIAYDLQNEHHFELLELDAKVDESGTTLLRVKPEDVSRIRLDENKEGPRGLDHRHILVYRYRPTVAEGSRLGLVMNDGKASVALLQRPEDVPSIKVGEGDEFVFEPSLTLSMIPLSEPLELIFDGKPACEVEVDPLGRVHLSGLNELFAKSDSPSVRFEAGLGFGRVTSLPFSLHR